MNRETDLLKALLKRHGYSVTKARLALFKALGSKASQTTQELIDRLSKEDQATVYRNLNLFEELGIIRRLHIGKFSRFELSDIFRHHHHHLACTNCGRVIILTMNPVLEEIIGRLSIKSGFRPLDHQLEVRGLCQACQQQL